MARVYIVTEEEMLSLIESLELHKLRDNNLWHPERKEYLDNEEKKKMRPVMEDIHRSFHYVVVRWTQSMGFKGHRG